MLGQGSGNYGPWIKSGPTPVFAWLKAKNGFYAFISLKKNQRKNIIIHFYLRNIIFIEKM